MDRILPREKSFSSLSRKRTASTASNTPSDQKPEEDKSVPYRDPRYETLLIMKLSYIDTSDLDISETGKRFILGLLSHEQLNPNETIFDDTTFADACHNLRNSNEARVIQDISRLIVPSAESLSLHAKGLKLLVESVNEGWSNSIPLTGPRP